MNLSIVLSVVDAEYLSIILLALNAEYLCIIVGIVGIVGVTNLSGFTVPVLGLDLFKSCFISQQLDPH
jgi:hypothetical protein